MWLEPRGCSSPARGERAPHSQTLGWGQKSIEGLLFGLFLRCLLLTGFPPDLGAASLLPIEVTQPIGTEEGLWLGCTTYVGYFGSPVPGMEIEHTCDSNSVVTPWGPRNLNLANLAGLKVAVRRFDEVSGLAGDTIVVTIDTSALWYDRVMSVSVDTVVAATVDCIRENAARGASRWPQLRHLRLSVVGSSRYTRYNRIYAVSPAVRRRQFH